MKNSTKFKTTLCQFIIAAVIVTGITACSNSNKPADTKEIAEDQNEEKFDERDKEKDAQFLVNAAEINLEEIQLGEMAQKNSKMSDVKDLGKMMVDAHTKSWNDLTALAAKKSVSIPASPTDDAKDAYEKLSKKTGKEFDKEYCDMMVKGHKNAISVFEKASTDSKDADIRTWATETLPELRKHLDHSISCQEKCEKM